MTTGPRLAEIALAIIGGGPNCTYAVERLAVVLGKRPRAGRIRIDIFEKTGFFGAGNVHRPDQPASSLLNRIIGQVAFAPDESYTAAGDLLPKTLRPTMVQWAQERYRLTGDDTYNLAPEAWPPRRLLGEALVEHFDRYLALLRAVPGVEVHLHAVEVTRLDRRGEHYLLAFGDPTESLVVDHVLLLTGNSVNRPRPDSLEARLADRAKRGGFDFVAYPYPLMNIPAEATAPDKVVGCIGLGQTANDVILWLTEERGGRFVPAADGDGLEYIPSGREPRRIVAMSQSGVFTAARPYNQKMADPSSGEHQGVFFTNGTIDALRRHRGAPVTVEGVGEQRQLDFERDVFPVMLLEMEILYYKTLFGPTFGEDVIAASRPRLQEFLESTPDRWTRDSACGFLLEPVRTRVHEAVEILERLLGGADVEAATADRRSVLLSYLGVVFGESVRARGERLVLERDGSGLRALLDQSPTQFGHPREPKRHLFSWQRLIEPIPAGACEGPDGYREALLAYMKYDHLQSHQGNVRNPTKAATDGVWRDIRETIAYAIDFAGLTAASHRTFLQVYLRYHNRLADGACIELMEKMRALVRSGVLDVSTGPDPSVVIGEDGAVRIRGPHTGSDQRVDTIVDGKLSNVDLRRDASPLYQSLLDGGLLRVWENPGRDGGPAFAPGGPALSRDSHPIGADGQIDERITVLGPPSEGIMFFQGTLGRPFCNHQVLNETIRWARHLEAYLDASQGSVVRGSLTGGLHG